MKSILSKLMLFCLLSMIFSVSALADNLGPGDWVLTDKGYGQICGTQYDINISNKYWLLLEGPNGATSLLPILKSECTPAPWKTGTTEDLPVQNPELLKFIRQFESQNG